MDIRENATGNRYRYRFDFAHKFGKLHLPSISTYFLAAWVVSKFVKTLIFILEQAELAENRISEYLINI